MSRKLIWTAVVALPLAITGLVFAASHSAGGTKGASADGFVCPITGEELPCEKCCPLND